MTGLSPGQRATARRIAWTAFVLGAGASVAANVAHTLTPPAYVLTAWATSGRQPAALVWDAPAGSVVAAAWSPVALLFTVELLSRVPWPASPWRALPRYAAAVVVATVAAVVSYRHMAGLLASYGEDGLTAAIEPLSVDGLMVVSALALLALSHPATTATTAATGTSGNEDQAARTPPPAPPAVDRAPRPARSQPRQATRPRRASAGTSARAGDDLAPIARAVAAALAREGRPLTRAALIAGVRARGRGISTGRATDLLRQLRTPGLAPVTEPTTDPEPSTGAAAEAA